MSNNTRTAANSKAAETNTGWAFRGAGALQQARKVGEAAAQKKANAGVWRFYLQYGTEAEVVILDKSIDDLFAIWEHQIPGPGNNFKESTFEVSLKTLCQEDPLTTHPVVNGKTNEPYYVGFFTILDMRPSVSKKDGSVIPYTRKLLPIKGSNQIEAFGQLAKVAMKKYGTLRGLWFRLVRPPEGGKISTRIGDIATLDNEEHMLEYGHFTEAQLLARFGHGAVKDSNGKEMIAANGKLQPFDYGKIFKEPNAADVRARYGIDAPIGSKEEAEQVWKDVQTQDFSAEDSSESEVDESELIDFTK
jgi:hypothetical protein